LQVPQLWVSADATGFTNLSKASIEALIDSLWRMHQSGVTLVTWGGTGSDWPKLINALPEHAQKIREMALSSVDIPLISAAANGMMMGLAATAAGMGLGARPACDSEVVPALWTSGDAVKQNEVLRHVEWDACACASLWSRLNFMSQFNRPQLSWITQKSGPRSVRLNRVKSGDAAWSLPNVREVMQWDEPSANFRIPAHLHPKSLTAWLKD
jgi:hypothetical protein